MEDSAVAAEISAACDVLTDLRSSRDEQKTSQAIRDISRVLHDHPEQRSYVFTLANSRGGISALLGILRCSVDSVPLPADAAACLALLVHQNPRAAHELASRDVLSPLLPLLYPRKTKPRTLSSSPDSSYPLSSSSLLLWSRECLPVYETVLVAIRKLTYHSPPLMRRLAEMGGIRLIIELATNPEFLAETSSFSAAASKRFSELTLGKKFIANAARAPKHTRSDLFTNFPAVKCLKNGDTYPYFVVDLVTDEREFVVGSLIDSGLVWPSHAPFPEGAEPVWTCVGVVCVEDPMHVWCQFCIDRPKPKLEAMIAALRNIAPPTDDCGSFEDIPEIGEFCIAYFDPRYSHTPFSIKEPLWGRGQLLGVEPGAKLRLLSIDFGMTATLPVSHVRPFPPECRGVSPLAVPCKVMGVSPIPFCTVVQENIAAILRNLSCENAAFRKEIVAFNGIETLLKLCQSCHVEVARQANAALLNMASSESREMGKRGAVETLLELVLRKATHPSVVTSSLAALHTLTAHNPHNLRRLSNQTSVGKLAEMLDRESLQGQDRESLGALIKLLSDPASSSVGQRSNRGNGEKQNKAANVVYRCLGDGEEGANDVKLEGEEEINGTISGGVVTKKTYVYKSYIGFQEDERRTFRGVRPGEAFSCSKLQSTICAMANTGVPCTIYVGVSPKGRIYGVKLSRRERDRVCIDIDGLMHRCFTPSIKHDRYKISFVPVVSSSGSGMGRTPLETYVLQLELEGCECRQLYTVQKEVEGERVQLCFSRCGNINIQVSPQGLRNQLAWEESNRHGSEIAGLLQDLGKLRIALDNVTMDTVAVETNQ